MSFNQTQCDQTQFMGELTQPISSSTMMNSQYWRLSLLCIPTVLHLPWYPAGWSRTCHRCSSPWFHYLHATIYCTCSSSLSWHNILSSKRMQSIAISVSVCLSACISQKPHVQNAYNSLCMSPEAVARSTSPDDNAIWISSNFVDHLSHNKAWQFTIIHQKAPPCCNPQYTYSQTDRHADCNTSHSLWCKEKTVQLKVTALSQAQTQT